MIRNASLRLDWGGGRRRFPADARRGVCSYHTAPTPHPLFVNSRFTQSPLCLRLTAPTSPQSSRGEAWFWGACGSDISFMPVSVPIESGRSVVMMGFAPLSPPAAPTSPLCPYGCQSSRGEAWFWGRLRLRHLLYARIGAHRVGERRIFDVQRSSPKPTRHRRVGVSIGEVGVGAFQPTLGGASAATTQLQHPILFL